MEFAFGVFDQRSLDFCTEIFGDVIDGSSAKTLCQNLNFLGIGQELLALQVSICALARTDRMQK